MKLRLRKPALALLGTLLFTQCAWAQADFDRLSVYFHEAKYEQLIAEGEPAAKQLTEQGDKAQAAQIYNMLGIVYMRLGRKDDMMRCFAISKGQSAEANQNSDDRETRERAVSDKAASLMASKDLEGTISYVDQQLAAWPADSNQRYWIFKPKFHALWMLKDQAAALAALDQETSTLEARLLTDPGNAKFYHANLGLTYLLGAMALAYVDQSTSLAYGKKADSHLDSLGGDLNSIPGGDSLGYRRAAASGRYADALALVEEYSKAYLASNDVFYGNQVIARNGYWLEQLGKDREALAQYLQAIHLLDGAWSNLKLKENKEFLISNFDRGEFFLPSSQLFERAIALALKLGETGKALELSELYKSRSLRDSLSRQGLEGIIPEGVPPALVKEEQDLYRQLADKPDPETVQKYLKVLTSIRAANPEFATLLSGDPGTLRLPKLQEGDVLVEYFVAAESTSIFVIKSDGSLKASTVPLGRDKLKQQVKDVRKAIKIQVAERVLKSQLKKLSDALLQPIEPDLASTRRLIFVPHGDLHSLPFSTLTTSDGKYLLESVEVVEAPSAYALSFGQDKNPRRRPGYEPEKASSQIFALGDFKSGNWTPLPGTQKEAEALKALYPQAGVLLASELKHADILKTLPQKSIVHFATHGYLDPKDPLSSGLVTATQPLTAGEILKQRLHAYNIFLSACETALGQETGADELVGLQQSFEYAGTPSVIASLWQISDEATAVLVEKFYKALETEPKAKALREAQLALLQQSRFQHPFYWSAFVLSGDWI